MEKGSLAEQALSQGIVDFNDKRVQFKAASVDSSAHLGQGKSGKQVFEVDLGNLKSLE